MHEFTHLIDLASARLGGQAIAANDEFFAGKENLLKPQAAVFIPDKYTDRGKWMDGWETRRRRTAGHDWCIVKLGLPGLVHTIVVDTSFFTGNYPSHCSLDGCGLPDGADATGDGVVWHSLLDRTELTGDTKNTLPIDPSLGRARRVSHVRLNIFPDGGVARLRVLGEALPDWARILASGEDIDLAAVVHGGYVVDTSDRFYGEPRNMLMPWRAENMGDGWETKRRRVPGHDWAVIRLGVSGTPRRIELDTAFFKGNYPDRASIDGAIVPESGHGGVSADVSSKAIGDWHAIVPETKLEADRVHTFTPASSTAASHVRLNIFPDGGVSRLRVIGTPEPDARRGAVLRFLNTSDDPAVRDAFRDLCAAPEWIDAMAAARPFSSPAAVLAAAARASDAVSPGGWREAFRHHPRIGERTAERLQSSTAQAASVREQSGMQRASAADAAALAEANRAYEARFGHTFIISASGKSAQEMLAALRERLNNDAAAELRINSEEQQKITKLRLEKLLG